MTDNVPITAGSGTDISTDDIAGVQVQRVKVQYGADGSATDVSSGSPLPVVDATLSTTNTEIGATNETAASTDTATAGLNGRLQRIAQRLTTLLAVFPTTIDTNSGSKSASTLRVVLATDQPALSNKLLVTPDALARTAQSMASADSTDAIMSSTTALTPKFAKISTSSSGASEVVALVSSKKLRVISLALVANAAVNAKFQSHTTPTDLTGLFYLAANGGFVLPYNPVGWFESLSGQALDINLSGAVAVGGMLTYIEV